MGPDSRRASPPQMLLTWYRAPTVWQVLSHVIVSINYEVGNTIPVFWMRKQAHRGKEEAEAGLVDQGPTSRSSCAISLYHILLSSSQGDPGQGERKGQGKSAHTHFQGLKPHSPSAGLPFLCPLADPALEQPVQLDSKVPGHSSSSEVGQRGGLKEFHCPTPV